jgi:hypothetical protein
MRHRKEPPMPPTPSPEEFAAMLARAGLTFSAAEQADMRNAYALLLPMLAALRTPAIPPQAEPAFSMRVERGA